MSYINNKAEARAIVRAIDEGKLDGESKAKAISALREFDRLNQPSTITQQASAGAKGFNVGFLADTLGAPVRLMNFLVKSADTGLEALGVPEDLIQPSEAPIGGTESIKEALVAGGMGYRDESELPIDQRALARGGRTIGQAVGMTAPIFGAASRVKPAQAAMQTVPKVATTASSPGKMAAVKSGLGREASMMRDTLSNVVKSTARSPGKMAAIEGTSALGAGTFRAGAEAIDPGNEYMGMAAELIGGVAGPAPLMQAGARQTRKLVENLSPSGRQTAARKKVEEVLQDSGFLTKTDPELDERRLTGLAKELRDAEGTGMTVGQVIKDPKARQAFNAIENTLIADANILVKQAVESQNKKTIENLNRKLNKLNNSTNPLVVKESQILRLDFLNKNLDKKLLNAENNAVDAVTKVLTKNKDDAVKASAEARQIIDNELKIARATESELWGKVDKNVNSPTKETISAFNSIKNEISPNEQVMKPLESFIQGLIKRKNATLAQTPGRGFLATAQQQGFQPVVRVSAKELFRKRSVALNLARQAKATGKFNDARMLNKLADGMLKDLNQVTDVTANVARDFSRSLNEKFNTKLIRGLRESDPGVFLEKAGQVSDAQRAFNFQALKRATERSNTNQVNPATETLNKLQRDFIEAAAADVIDPFTNQIKPATLSRFINNNQLTLKEVGMLSDMNNVDQKVKLATMLQNTAKKGKAFANNKSLAAQIARGSDDISEVVSRALDSNYQLQAFKDLAKTVGRSKNKDAINGLKHGVFDELIKRSLIKKGELDGLISGNKLEEILNTKSGNKTTKQNLVESGLITSQQAQNIDTVIQKTKLFEDAVNDPRMLNKLISAGDGVMDVIARVVGSAFGSMTALAQSSPLIMSAFGARLGKKALVEVPALKVQGVLTEAIRDPKLMRKLLDSRPKAPKATDTAIRGYLLQAGLLQD